MHRAIEPHPHHLRYAARIVAVCLVDLCLQHRPHVPRLNADHRQARFGENAVKPLRQRSGFQANSLEAIGIVRQHLQEGFRLTRHPRFPHDLARIIHNADARLLDRHIQSSKIVHAALLLRMLEAARCGPRFTISLKRSTLIFSYPQAGRTITPSFGAKRATLSGPAETICCLSAFGGEFNESTQHLLILADEEVCEWRGMHGHGSRRNRRLSCGSAGRAVNVWRTSRERLRGGTRAASIGSWLAMEGLLQRHAGGLW